MKTCGIVVEYNPFHNGHRYHIEAARKVTGAELIIAVMSGNFLQRGEPALVSKFTRTKMALLGGADLVVELPYAFSTQMAEVFARGAVQILSALGCESLCFGSESGNIEAFQKTLAFLKEFKIQYDELVKNYVKEGYSYPKANSLAYTNLPFSNDLVDLTKPNNILGYQYVKAISDLELPMKATTIQRIGASFHDESLSEVKIASATGIRNALFSKDGSVEMIKDQVPETTFQLLKEYIEEFGTFSSWENFWPFLQYRLLQTAPKELKTIYEMEEGLENRLLSAVKEAESFHDFMEKIKTKRYTWTRLQRVLTHVLTNTKKHEMEEAMKEVRYIRLLGANKNGRNYLKEMKENFSLPLISKLSAADPELLRLDIRAGEIYSFGYPGFIRRRLLELEFKQPPIIID